MDEPWFLRIKIHVLLNHSSYLRRGERESMMSFYTVRFVGLEVCGLRFGFITRSICKCFSQKKKKKALPLSLLDSKGYKTAQLDRAGNRPLLFLTYSLASTSGEYLSSIC